MTKEEILIEVQSIISSVLKKDVSITFETIAKDVDGWDSLSHITIVSAVERKFNFRFKMKDVVNMKNVGEMVDIIMSNIEG